ncbi:hypothetical protein ES703_10294 [subsurface metagenome]
MVSLRNRFRMAWRAFNCKPFEMVVEPFHDDGDLRLGAECDNNWRHRGATCHKEAVICMNRTIAKFRFVKEDHEHLCLDCATKIRGKFSTQRR